MAKWSGAWKSKTGNSVVYGPIGSGAGIAQITARTVDFGASDAPMTSSQASSCNGCMQIPWALSAVAVSYHVSGVPKYVHLSGPVVAGIYLGQIKTWNAKQIQALNPKVKLPATKITPVFRSDGSGTTYAFVDYLSHISSAWKAKVGTSTQVSFSTGVSGKGNPGVSAAINATNGAIGYVGVDYAYQNKLPVAAIQNAAGKFVFPYIVSMSAAAAAVKKAPANNEYHIVNPPKSAPKAYPISTFTYAIVPKSARQAGLLRNFILYAESPAAQAFGPSLIFAPLPKLVAAAALKTAKQIA